MQFVDETSGTVQAWDILEEKLEETANARCHVAPLSVE